MYTVYQVSDHHVLHVDVSSAALTICKYLAMITINNSSNNNPPVFLFINVDWLVKEQNNGSIHLPF